jgi:hypothetical protein
MSDSEDSYSSESSHSDDGFDQFEPLPDEENGDPFGGADGMNAFQTEVFDARITPGETEKLALLSSFQALREDGTFCDVAFLCQGTLFRAHRVVISAWSRWLSALLSEGSSEEVVHLDLFEPTAFKAVLDYMYGLPFYVNVDTIDGLMKVIRRLELHGLEKSCWILLMKFLDSHNAAQLHELADKYDCPPLKLAAWRIKQQQLLGPMAKHIDPDAMDFQKGTGLTGPGEAEFLHNITPQEIKDREILAEEPPVVPPAGAKGGDIDSDSGDDEEKSLDVPLPDELDTQASADELVKAWALRLHDVYADCGTQDMGGYDFRPTFSPSSSGGGDAVGGRRHEAGAKDLLRKIHNGHGITGREIKHQRGKDALVKGGINAGRTGRAAKKNLGPADIDWKAELKGFYLGINMSEKLPYLDDILEANRGKEEQMLSYLIVKYKRVIPDNLAAHLDTLQGFIETNTETSFDQR